MNFTQLQEALRANTLKDPIKAVKDFTLNHIGHIESRLLYNELLNEKISELLNYDQSPLAVQIESLTVVEQILDIEPNRLDIIINWLSLQVAFEFEQTDLDRYYDYLHVLKQDKEYYRKGILFEVDLHLFENNKLKAIELYLHLVEYCNQLENRLERDFYVSLFVYYAVYYLSDEEVSQNEKALDLLKTYVHQLTYEDVYPLFYLMSLALDHEDLVLIDKLAFQTIPVIQNNQQTQNTDVNLEELLVYVLNNYPNTEAVIHVYLSLQSRMYGDRKWNLEVQRLYNENPTSDYLKTAMGILLTENGQYLQALPLFESSLFTPIVQGNYIPHYMACHFYVKGSFPKVDFAAIKGNPIKLIDNTYILQQMNEHVGGELAEELIQIQLNLYQKAEELFYNYLSQNQYSSSALMERHTIAQMYHNMACFISNNELEAHYSKALEYSNESQKYSFFYYQLSYKCNLYKSLKDDESFLEAIRTYLSYPIFQADPADYFRFKLQLVTVLVRLGNTQEAIAVYKEVKPELMDYFRANGTSDFDESYLVHAFEADDSIFEYLEDEDKDPIYTPFEYSQFFPKNVDVLYRLILAYYAAGNLVNFEIFADQFFNAFGELDYAWNNEFYHIMELYLPVCYKTSPKDAIEWLDILERNKVEVPWLEGYLKQYKSKEENKGFFKKLFS